MINKETLKEALRETYDEIREEEETDGETTVYVFIGVSLLLFVGFVWLL